MTSICMEPVTGPSVWRREDVEDPAGWTHELSEPMRAEITRAAAKLTEDGTVGSATREDVDLPLVGPLIKRVVDQLEHGRGLALLKGVPIEGLTVPEAQAVAWALGAHLGIGVRQNGRGERIVSIRDRGVDLGSSRTARGYQTNESLPFHSDAPDLAALLCLRQARSGGVFSVASAHHIYNELLRTAPELIGVYYAGFLFDYRGDEPPGEPPAYHNAIFGYYGGEVICRYFLRQFAESGPERLGLTLSPVQREALDAFEEVPLREESHVSMRLEPGDLQLVDDNVTVHRRTAYEHGDVAEDSRRHLLRMWINVRGGRQFPTFMSTHRWGMEPVTTVAG
jgi:hypothetical protein